MKLSLFFIAAAVTFAAASPGPAFPKPATNEIAFAKRQVNTASLRSRGNAPRIAQRAGPSAAIATSVLVSRFVNCPLPPADSTFTYDFATRFIPSDSDSVPNVECDYKRTATSQAYVCNYNGDTGAGVIQNNDPSCPRFIEAAPSSGNYCYTACPVRARNANLASAFVDTSRRDDPFLRCNYADDNACYYDLAIGVSKGGLNCPLVSPTSSCITTIAD